MRLFHGVFFQMNGTFLYWCSGKFRFFLDMCSFAKPPFLITTKIIYQASFRLYRQVSGQSNIATICVENHKPFILHKPFQRLPLLVNLIESKKAESDRILSS